VRTENFIASPVVQYTGCAVFENFGVQILLVSMLDLMITQAKNQMLCFLKNIYSIHQKW